MDTHDELSLPVTVKLEKDDYCSNEIYLRETDALLDEVEVPCVHSSVDSAADEVEVPCDDLFVSTAIKTEKNDCGITEVYVPEVACKWSENEMAYMPKNSANRGAKRKLVFTPEMMDDIKRKLSDGKESVRAIARFYNVPESTLRKRLKSDHIPKSLGRFVNTFSVEMERELCDYIKEMDIIFHGLTRKQIMKLAFEYAEINNIEHRFVNGCAGQKWFSRFCKSNNFSLSVPEKMSACRAEGFNSTQVDNFYVNLKSLFDKYKFPAHRIYNMGESSLSTIPSEMETVVFPTNKKKVSKITSGEKGETITIVACMQPTGFSVPPAMIFPRIRYHSHLYEGAPNGTAKLHHETGCMTTDLFLDWLSHFQEYVQSSEENPSLLILDNRISHQSLQAIKFCRENHIHLLTFPLHITHEMQPLDTTFFGPLKGHYSTACSNFAIGKRESAIIKIEDVAELFKTVYNDTASVAIAESGFQNTGIWPYNPQVFTDVHFAGSKVTERPATNHNDDLDVMDECRTFAPSLQKSNETQLCFDSSAQEISSL